MIVEELRQSELAKSDYETNIATVVEKIEVEQKPFGIFLAKIPGILKKKKSKKIRLMIPFSFTSTIRSILLQYNVYFTSFI